MKKLFQMFNIKRKGTAPKKDKEQHGSTSSPNSDNDKFQKQALDYPVTKKGRLKK